MKGKFGQCNVSSPILINSKITGMKITPSVARFETSNCAIGLKKKTYWKYTKFIFSNIFGESRSVKFLPKKLRKKCLIFRRRLFCQKICSKFIFFLRNDFFMLEWVVLCRQEMAKSEYFQPRALSAVDWPSWDCLASTHSTDHLAGRWRWTLHYKLTATDGEIKLL